MIAQRWIELMNAEIDGANPPQDSRRLAAFLASDEEARLHFDELRAAVELLEQVEPHAPPPDLRAAILAAAGAAAGAAPPGRGPARPGLRRPAYAFAAGLALGMLLLGAIWPRLEAVRTPAHDTLYGTVVPGVQRGIVYAEQGVSGHVTVRFAADHVAVEVELDAPDGTVRLEIAHDPTLVVAGLRARGPAAPVLAAGDGHLVLEHAGRGAYEFVFRGAGVRRPLQVALRLDGVLLREQEIAPR